MSRLPVLSWEFPAGPQLRFSFSKLSESLVMVLPRSMENDHDEYRARTGSDGHVSGGLLAISWWCPDGLSCKWSARSVSPRLLSSSAVQMQCADCFEKRCKRRQSQA